MKQLAKIFFLLAVLSTCVFAQGKLKVIDKTQLNGVWVFDSKASKANALTKELYENQDITISYKEPELKIWFFIPNIQQQYKVRLLLNVRNEKPNYPRTSKIIVSFERLL